MKKILIISMLIIVAASVNTLQAQFNGGFKMGVDFSKLVIKMDGESSNDEEELKRLIAPRLGFFGDYKITDEFFVHAGVFGSIRGLKSDGLRWLDDTTVVDSKEYEVIIYVDIPVNFGYMYDLGGARLFAMAGPMFSFGTYTTHLFKANGEWDNEAQSIGNTDYDDYQSFNLSVTLEGGIEVDRFQFSLFYNQGISNADDIKTTSNIIGLTAAVKFGSVDSGRRGGYKYKRR